MMELFLRPRRRSGKSRRSYGPRFVERSTHAKVPYPELKIAELKFRDKNNFAMGFSTNQTENFQGYHGKYVLIIVDEAPGIEPEFATQFSAPWPLANVHIVMAGNPTIPSGPFFDAFNRKERSGIVLQSTPSIRPI